MLEKKKKRKNGGWADNNDITTTNIPFPLFPLLFTLMRESGFVFGKHQPCQDWLELWIKMREHVL